MTSLTWPDGLPVTLKASGLSGAYKDPVVRTDMDAGPQKTRLRYTGAPKVFSGSITINETQRALLDYFFTITTRFGVLRFTMTNPQTLEVEEFRFSAPPQETGNDGGLFDVSIQMERM